MVLENEMMRQGMKVDLLLSMQRCSRVCTLKFLSAKGARVRDLWHEHNLLLLRVNSRRSAHSAGPSSMNWRFGSEQLTSIALLLITA